MPKPGIILAQLGGPDTLADVRPFLFNFFTDLIPDNIPMPRAMIRPAAWILAAWRAPHSRRLYASIGGGSPLRSQTDLQAQALRDELRHRGRDWPVYVAMRNWHPYSREALEAARTNGRDVLLFLPLYPQYSFATTRSSLSELKRAIEASGYHPDLVVVEEYCEDPRYIAGLASLTRRHLNAFVAPPLEVHLIFSAHGLPLKYIERGDPYAAHVRRTMEATLALLGHPGPAHLSFQSRLGPAKWLGPSTERLIAQLAAEGARAMCIVPVAFVSEHVETLNEIDIVYAEVARQHGVVEFRRVCALKCHPEYIRCLADQAEHAIGVEVNKDVARGRSPTCPDNVARGRSPLFASTEGRPS
jgi:protoporphyrin/coproporphyrin ferrochelatase